MGDLALQLVPEMVGLAVTPAAVIACLVLLGSSHPARNVATMASVVLCVYAVFSLAVLTAGRAAGTASEPTEARGWVSIAAGALFVVGGLLSWWSARQPAVAGHPPSTGAPSRTDAQPGWATALRDPSLRSVALVALALAVINPNVAILASGLGAVLTADVSLGGQLVGVALLLAASVVDFVVPALAFALSGQRGRRMLDTATRWLLAHNRPIGIVVLLGFGILFVSRGVGQLAG